MKSTQVITDSDLIIFLQYLSQSTSQLNIISKHGCASVSAEELTSKTESVGNTATATDQSQAQEPS